MGETTGEHESDGALMARTACGPEAAAFAAFDALFERHRRAVYAFLRRMTDAETLAEDLTQETFLRLWRARHAYRPGAATLRTYLLTIARRLALDAAKRRDVRAEPLPNGGDGSGGGLSDGPEAALLAREMQAVVEEAVARLPLEMREALLLRDGEGLTYDEIAAITGCPVGTVKSRLNAARARLRDAARAYQDSET